MSWFRAPTVVAALVSGPILVWAVCVAPQMWWLVMPWAITAAAAVGHARQRRSAGYEPSAVTRPGRGSTSGG